MRKLLMLLGVIFFLGCEPLTEPVDNYKGAVIGNKYVSIYYRFSIKYMDVDSVYKVKNIRVLNLDWNSYEIGDTIK